MTTPTHIGMILDGNRRFAKRLMKKPWMGHKWGLEKSRDVIEWACEAGVKYITAYVLSLENYKTRPTRERNYILKYFESELDNVLHNKEHITHRMKVRVQFIGRVRILPSKMQKKMKKVEKTTSKYSNHFLNIAVAYGGQQEIVDAAKEILKKGLKGIIKPSDLDENLFRHHLWTNGQPELDMIIRSGGEQRLSNFMPFQSAYSELIFTKKKWPELTKRDFRGFLREYERRQRRFGK